MVGFVGVVFLMVLGSILSDTATTITFIAGFYILRSRAGGYHASRFSTCLVLSVATLVANIYVVTPIIIHYLPIAPLTVVSICYVVLMLLGTVAHPNIELSETEMAGQCVLMRVITTAQYLAIILLVAFDPKSVYAASLASGMGFVAISSIIGKIKMKGGVVK